MWAGLETEVVQMKAGKDAWQLDTSPFFYILQDFLELVVCRSKCHSGAPGSLKMSPKCQTGPERVRKHIWCRFQCIVSGIGVILLKTYFTAGKYFWNRCYVTREKVRNGPINSVAGGRWTSWAVRPGCYSRTGRLNMFLKHLRWEIRSEQDHGSCLISTS